MNNSLFKSVHLWAKKHVESGLNKILTTVPLGITACVKDDNFCKPLQLLQTRLDAIMIGCYQLMTQLMSPFKKWEFPFLEKGEFTFFHRRFLQSLSVSTSYKVKSPVLGWRPDLSRFYQRVQRSKKRRENRGL